MGKEEPAGAEQEGQERAGEEDKAGQMNWRMRRRKDRLAQWAYFQDNPYCEICLAEGRGTRLADEIHEITYKSQMGKCVPENMISVCRPDHDRAHFLRRPYLSKEQLFEIKAKVEKERRGEYVFGGVN